MYNMKSLEQAYLQEQLRQGRQLKEAEMQFDIAMTQAGIAPVQLNAANDAYAQAKARYDSGLIDLPTFLQTLVTLNRAESDAYLAYANAWRALLMKAAASGDLSMFLNQLK